MGDLPVKGHDKLRPGAQVVDHGHRYTPRLTFYSYASGELEAGAYVTGFDVSTDLSNPEGQWSATLKRRIFPLGDSDAQPDVDRDWGALLSPGDWCLITVHDGHHGWPLRLGRIDDIHRSREAGQGGVTRYTYSVSGSNAGSCLTKHEVVVLPQFKGATAADLLRDLGPFHRSLGRVLFRFGKDGVAPHELVPSLLYFFLGRYTGETYGRSAAPVFTLPPTMPVKPIGRPEDVFGRLGDGWPLGDLLRFETERLDGRVVIRELMAGLPDGQRLWDYLGSFSDPDVNEFFVDFLPNSWEVGKSMSVEDFTHDGGDIDFSPRAVLRRRPFPSEAYMTARAIGFGVEPIGPTGVERWQRLPWTMIDERQLQSDETGRSDRERFNFYLSLPHSSFGGHPYSLALGSGSRGELPITAGTRNAVGEGTDLDRAERHGWRRREIRSPYLPTDPRAHTAQYYVWSRLLADWNQGNAERWSGTLTTGRMLPGVRVGERLHVFRDGRSRVEGYYIERVSHSWRRAGTGERTSTTMSVTRGSEDPLGGYSPKGWGADTDGADLRRILIGDTA